MEEGPLGPQDGAVLGALVNQSATGIPRAGYSGSSVRPPRLTAMITGHPYRCLPAPYRVAILFLCPPISWMIR